MPYCLKSKEFNELESYGYIYDGTNLKQIWYWYVLQNMCEIWITIENIKYEKALRDKLVS